MVEKTGPDQSFDGPSQLRVQAVKQEAVDNVILTSFVVELELRNSENMVPLAGLSGFLLDFQQGADSNVCVTIDNALRRHTPPKRMTITSGLNARRDLNGGTDSRILVEGECALFFWLPEVNEGANNAGTRLLQQFRRFLEPKNRAVMIDFGVEDEQEGYVKIFYPYLDNMSLELSKSGQFASGVWNDGTLIRTPKREVGVVYL